MLIAAYDTIEATRFCVWFVFGTGELYRIASVIDFASF